MRPISLMWDYTTAHKLRIYASGNRQVQRGRGGPTLPLMVNQVRHTSGSTSTQCAAGSPRLLLPRGPFAQAGIVVLVAVLQGRGFVAVSFHLRLHGRYLAKFNTQEYVIPGVIKRLLKVITVDDQRSSAHPGNPG
jgi:hypothetical protein